MKKKLKIAITGGIGSGKSVLTDIIRKKGYDVFIADDLSKELLTNDPEVIAKIKTSFGKESYLNGKPNKKYLADQVFSDPQKLAIINDIIHTPTIAKQEELMSQSLRKKNLTFVESALIFEAEVESHFDYVILVSSSRENKIERVIARNGISKEEILKRIENQIPDDEKKGASDFVIDNNSSLKDFQNKAVFILSLLENMTTK